MGEDRPIQLSLLPGVAPIEVLDVVHHVRTPFVKVEENRDKGNIAYLPDGRLARVLMTNDNGDCLLSVQGVPVVFAEVDLNFTGVTVAGGPIEQHRQDVYLEMTALALAMHSTFTSGIVDIAELQFEYDLRHRLLKAIDQEILVRAEAKKVLPDG